MSRAWLTAAFASLLVAAAGCGSARVVSPGATVGRDELLAGAFPGLAAAASRLPEDREVLALTPEMETFLAANVDRAASADVRLGQLIGAIMDSGSFGLEYDAITRTASETFHARRGNCLSFASMFVAMARHAGLDVAYQEVEVPPVWTLNDGTFVFNRHVNVHVDLGGMGTRVVDFNIADFRANYRMRRISDGRAVAHYFNNVGVERMQAGDPASALAAFRRSIAAADHLSAAAWANLGTLYLRQGDRARAEAAYREALRAEPSDLVAMSNLARFYELAGDERAALYQKRVIHHRNLNPYYRYELARRAYSARQYGETIRHVKYAIRKRRSDDRFYFLLALAYLGKGEERAAVRWMAAAEKVAARDLKHAYSEKIEALLRKQ